MHRGRNRVQGSLAASLMFVLTAWAVAAWVCCCGGGDEEGSEIPGGGTDRCYQWFVSVPAVLIAAAYSLSAAVAVLVQSCYGWPPGTSLLHTVLDGLHPRRTVNIVAAAFGQLALVAHARLYLRWTLAYARLRREGRLHTDIQYAPGRYLDVYPADAAAAAAASPTSRCGKGGRVMVFVYGGGWISGDKQMYCLLGRRFSKQGYSVVIPNYTLFPKGDIGHMLTDLLECLLWVQRNAREYNGDPVGASRAPGSLACIR